MIFDKLKNYTYYSLLHPLFDEAFHYLLHTDFDNLEVGIHEIRGKDLYAVVQVYETKRPSEAILEAHREYIDIQFVAQGKEVLLFTNIEDTTIFKEYDQVNDFGLFTGEPFGLELQQGQFVILFPHDSHAPGVHFLGEKQSVKKIVLKVRI